MTERETWRDFVALLRSAEFPPDRIRPYDELLREPLRTFLSAMRAQASPSDLQQEPETHRVGDHVHYVLPLTLGEETASYCFTFVLEGDEWHFRHVESITIRLDQVSPPTSTFPDLSDEQKHWMREEWRVTELVRLYSFLAQERGPEFALNWFRDGAGYALAARTWVPFVPPAQAFVLYLCWEQVHLHGSEVTLEELSDERATVRLRPLTFALYERTGHLRQQIGFEDYRRLFETVWEDRAQAAGWELGITYAEGECVFGFRASAAGGGARDPACDTPEAAPATS